jgi:hypothetical protein
MFNLSNFYNLLYSKSNEPIIIELEDFIQNNFPIFLKEDINIISENFFTFLSKISYEFTKINKIELYTEKNIFNTISDNFENIITKTLYDDIFNKIEDEKELNYEKLSNIKMENLGLDLNIFNTDFIDYYMNNILAIKSEFNFDFTNSINDIIDDNNNENNNIKINIKNILSFELRKFYQFSFKNSPKNKLNILCNLCNFIIKIYSQNDRIKLTKFLTYLFINCGIKNLKKHFYYCIFFRNKIALSSEEDFFLSISLQSLNFAYKLNEKVENIKNDNNNSNEILFDYKSYSNKIEKLISCKDYNNLPIKDLKEEIISKENNINYTLTKQDYYDIQKNFKYIIENLL